MAECAVRLPASPTVSGGEAGTLEGTMGSRAMSRATGGVVAGVLGGIAAYFGWDATRLRIAYVILTLGTAGFPGVVLYACLWWLMPPASEAAAARTDRRDAAAS